MKLYFLFITRNFIVDPFGELIGENQDNNYGSLTINNSSPLEDVTWNIYRDE